MSIFGVKYFDCRQFYSVNINKCPKRIRTRDLRFSVKPDTLTSELSDIEPTQLQTNNSTKSFNILS